MMRLAAETAQLRLFKHVFMVHVFCVFLMAGGWISGKGGESEGGLSDGFGRNDPAVEVNNRNETIFVRILIYFALWSSCGSIL